MMRHGPFPESAATRLVVYGSLAPGESNHHVISHIRGHWLPCAITGTIHVSGGYRVLSWNPDGPSFQALLFTSAELPQHWKMIDEFEGAGYRRIVIPAQVEGAEVMTNVYVGA